ncbi:MAG TPA: lysylphosphatidylglycerol synthase transmembrane domain-containing protein [Gaiellaceae bacterium]|nr:lysylphosphatidylglycerol synthase transmembrane domain-containing protein [Gaiellaceae bacterium]
MGAVFDAIGVFFEQLTSVGWKSLGLAVLAHLVKTCCTSRAWWNVLGAAYPEERPRWRTVHGSYVSGVGVNAIVPARGGDAVRLFLAHRAIPGAKYTTLASTLLVMTIFDSTAALLIFAYALTLGVLPSITALGSLPGFEFGWVFSNRAFAVVLFTSLAIVAFFGFFWIRFRIRDFRERVTQGLAVLADRRQYLRTVAAWQAGDWALRFVAIWFFLGAFGIEQSIQNVLLVQVTQSLATLVPVSPGGIGTEQAFIVYVFRDSVVSRSRLISYSVGMKVTLTVVNAIVGFTALFLMLGHVRWRELGGGERPATGT